MVRIAIFSYFFPPKWQAGTELATYYLAQHLQARGNEIHVLTSRDRGMPKEDRYEGVAVHRLYWPKKTQLLARCSSPFSVLTAVRKIDPQIIHIQNLLDGSCGLLTKHFLNKPYIVAGHGSEVYLPQQLHPTEIFNRLLKRVVRTTTRRADAVTALTDDMRSRIQTNYGTDAVVIPNGIDVDRFTGAISKEEARNRLRLEVENAVVASLGNLRAVKGIEYLVRAFDTIHAEKPKTRLLVIGDGEEKPKLEALVGELDLSESVIFAGSVPNKVIPIYLVASDVFVMPSLSEGFGITLLEAMAAGLPIVATNVGGIPSLIADAVNGFLVQPRDAAQIANRVLRLLADRPLASQMVQHNRELIKQYSWDEVASRYEEVYLRCLALS